MTTLVRLDNLQQFVAINLSSDPGYDKGNRTIPQTAQIVLGWATGSGVNAHNVLHGSYQGVFHGSQAEANAILTFLTTGANWNGLAAHIAPTCGLVGVTIRDLNVKDAPIIASSGTGAMGTSTGTELPNEVALVATCRTAFVGRQNRGRVYIPGWATTALGANNVVNAAAITAAQNWSSIIAGALQASGYVFGIGHFHRLAYTSANGTDHPERPAGLVPITNVAIRDNHWDTQRRRGLK